MIFLARRRLMTAIHRQDERFGFRVFMVKHQYKVMALSVCFGLAWVGIYHLAAKSWFFSRLSVLIAIICFVPAGIVVLIHGREFGPFLWWDRSNRVLTTRAARGQTPITPVPPQERPEFSSVDKNNNPGRNKTNDCNQHAQARKEPRLSS